VILARWRAGVARASGGVAPCGYNVCLGNLGGGLGEWREFMAT
jgi:hypothetical protein